MTFKGKQFDKLVILTCVRYYLKYKLSYRDEEEIFADRGIEVDHSTIQRWVVEYAPQLMEEARKFKKNVLIERIKYI